MLSSFFCLHMIIWRCRPWVWLHTVLFRIIWFDMVQFGTSYTNLRCPHILKHQI